MKYPALRIIAKVYKVLAWLVVVGGVLGSFITPAGADTGGVGVAYVTGGLLLTAFCFLMFYAAAEGIRVLLDIEENTRGLSSKGGPVDVGADKVTRT